MASFLDTLLRNIAGKTGKAIDTVGNALGNPFGQGTGGVDISSTLQNWGGNVAGSLKSAIVPTVYADDGSMSGLGGGSNSGGGGMAGGSDSVTTPSGGNRVTNPTPSVSDPVADRQADQAGDARTSELNAILARLNMMRDTVNRLRGNAATVRDQIVGDIGTRYGNLKTSVQNKVGTALENLGQEDLGVQNTYGRAAGNARRAMESALTRNRVMARAMGRLNSSFYDDSQGSTLRGGQTAVSDIGSEEAGKRAAIGTRKTETKNWGVEQGQNLDLEENSLVNQAQNEYADAMAAADDLEKSTGINTYEAAAAAEQNYQSRLSQIQNYIQNKAITLAQVAASTQPFSTAIDSFTSVTPALAEKLSNARSLNNASSFLSLIPTLGGQSAQSTDASTLMGLNENQGNGYEEILRRLGLLRA